MKYAVLIDFGSTFTKMVLVNLDAGEVVKTDKFPSTVKTDAAIGLHQCFDSARAAIGASDFNEAEKLATSSAAGGLRMTVVGLTKAVSSTAGRNASFSAGAKVIGSVSGRLTDEHLEAINESDTEILLMCGGYEGGNVRDLIHNAEIIAKSRLTVPVIFAGNSSVATTVRGILKSCGKECFVAENIIPKVGSLNIKPTTDIIRELFMDRITNMKGVGEVQSEMAEKIIPTPAAVLAAGQLLSRGTEKTEGLSDFMMADIGGATTDIYSYIENTGFDGAKRVGSPEPFAKRTVEGDMGMRESSICILNELGSEKLAQSAGVTEDMVQQAIDHRIHDTGYVADSAPEQAIDLTLAKNAVKISASRHAGRTTREYQGRSRLIQRGKNLTEIKTIIGTGGIIVNSDHAEEILKNAAAQGSSSEGVLLPEKVEPLVDHDYVLYAAGLLQDHAPEAALSIMRASLRI